MKRNLSNLDRGVRAVLGVLLIALYAMGTLSGTLGLVLAILGGVFLVTAVVAFCPLYLPFKFSTFK
ncbi:MAG: DUF2892 domain-containing protein [Anaerolineales bacterium]